MFELLYSMESTNMYLYPLTNPGHKKKKKKKKLSYYMHFHWCVRMTVCTHACEVLGRNVFEIYFIKAVDTALFLCLHSLI